MAGPAKFVLSRNQKAEQIVISAGAATGTDQISLNLDYTLMTRGEAVLALDAIKERILEGLWPPL